MAEVRPALEELYLGLYPREIIEAFGFHGKLSGNVSAVGEIPGAVAVAHGPRGCAWHHRHSTRRKHEIFDDLYSTDLTESDIIYGAGDKLLETVRGIWREKHPPLIVLLPTVVSDILNEDVFHAAQLLRQEGIPAVSVKSEVFSHRERGYTRDRFRQINDQDIAHVEKLPSELVGCGYSEAVIALMRGWMEPGEVIPHSINLEMGWGSETHRSFAEIEAFLTRCGVTINCHLPSAPPEKLRTAPRAQLNVICRYRWAKVMKELFGTDCLVLNEGGGGRYVGLEGICAFYRDLAEALGIEAQMEEQLAIERERFLQATAEARAQLEKRRGIVVTSDVKMAPYYYKKYVQDFGLRIEHLIILLTGDARRDFAIDSETEQRLLRRFDRAVELWGGGETQVSVNPDEESLGRILSQGYVIVGTDDFTLEGRGSVMVPHVPEESSVSFEAYARAVNRAARLAAMRGEKPELLLNRIPFSSQHLPISDTPVNRAAKESWARQWQ